MTAALDHERRQDGQRNRKLGSGPAKWNPFHRDHIGDRQQYMWHGMRAGVWFRTLADGNFDVTVNCLPRILGVTAVSPLNSLAHRISEGIYGGAADDVQVLPPIFILGSWRTGSTLLHELLACDDRFGFPTVLQCMFPSCFLLVGPSLNWADAFLPKSRPQDNMSFATGSPSEEEFAMAILGFGSPHQSTFFPRHGVKGLDYLDLAELSEAERRKWEEGYLSFIRRVQLAHGDKPLLIKSPTNTARVAMLRRLFPDARFLHIARHPYDVYPSIVHTWKTIQSGQALQNPILDNDGRIEEMAFEVIDRMYRAYDADREEITDGHLIEVTYEQLVADPKTLLRDVYRMWDLGDFASAEPATDAYLKERRDYRRNKYRLSDKDKATIARRWRHYFERFGYDV